MKTILIGILKALFYPLVWCHRVIAEAPVISCGSEMIGSSDCGMYIASEKPCRCHSHAQM